MCVVTIVVSCLYYLDISFGQSRLLCKLLLKVVGRHVEVAVEEPAHESQCKHVAAFGHGLHVHARVGQAVFHHLGDRTCNDAVGVDAHLAEVVGGLECSLLEVLRSERVGIDDYSRPWLGISVLGLECCGIHGHEHVAEVARGIDLFCSDVYLETRNTCQRALRCAYVGRIVGEGTDAVTHGSRNGREDVSGQLHAVAGVTRESDYYFVQFFYFQFV